MSEENKTNCQKGWLIFTLILSLISFSLSTFLAIKLGVFTPDVKISTKYDKGQTFEKAIATEKPAIIWFYTDWCGYCKRFAPTFDKVVKSKEIKENYAVAFVNCDASENAQLMKEYRIDSFPTVYLRKPNGEKKMVDHEDLFTADAIKELKEEFLEFIGKD